MRGFTLIGIVLLEGLLGLGCGHKLSYIDVPISDRHTHTLGLEALFLKHLENNPQNWPKLIRVLTRADDALQAHRIITRAGVMRWINQQIKREGFHEREMTGLFFIRSVYLQGWDRGYLNFVDDEDRELLQNLISGIMGALHKCQTCTVSHP